MQVNNPNLPKNDDQWCSATQSDFAGHHCSDLILGSRMLGNGFHENRLMNESGFHENRFMNDLVAPVDGAESGGTSSPAATTPHLVISGWTPNLAPTAQKNRPSPGRQAHSRPAVRVHHPTPAPEVAVESGGDVALGAVPHLGDGAHPNSAAVCLGRLHAWRKNVPVRLLSGQPRLLRSIHGKLATMGGLCRRGRARESRQSNGDLGWWRGRSPAPLPPHRYGSRLTFSEYL
jgi:hypothetical protein